MRHALPAALVLLMLAAPASAQQVNLRMRDGLVDLDARNVPVRQILLEWARVGRVSVVNADQITAPPVTLLLNGVPERQALDSILRGVAGFMAAARPPGGQAGEARYDRVIILASSAAPAAAPAPAGPARGMPPAFPRPEVQPDSDEGTPDGGPVQVFPGNAGFPRVPPGVNMPPTGGGPITGVTRPFQMPGAPPQGAVPATEGEPPSRPNPFGISTGSGTPGVITPIAPQGPVPPTNPGVIGSGAPPNAR